jgi:hypothetical protein
MSTMIYNHDIVTIAMNRLQKHIDAKYQQSRAFYLRNKNDPYYKGKPDILRKDVIEYIKKHIPFGYEEVENTKTNRKYIYRILVECNFD